MCGKRAEFPRGTGHIYGGGALKVGVGRHDVDVGMRMGRVVGEKEKHGQRCVCARGGGGRRGKATALDLQSLGAKQGHRKEAPQCQAGVLR